jgi:hypothetical protein
MFHVVDRKDNSSIAIEARSQPRPKARMPARSASVMSNINVDNLDCNWKVLHSSFHPQV